MNKTLFQTELIQALTTSVCPNESWAQMYANHEAQLSIVVNSQLTTTEKIRHLDHLIAELSAIMACGVEKKYSLLRN